MERAVKNSPRKITRQVKDRVLRIEHAFGERFLIMREHGHVGEYLRPGCGFEFADGRNDPQHQADAKGDGAGNDLIFRQTRDERSNGQQRSGLQQQTEIPNRQRLPIGVAVFEKKCEVQRGKQQHAGIERKRGKPFSEDHFRVADGRGCQQFDGAAALLFGKQTHRDQGNQEQADHALGSQQRPYDLLVEIHGQGLAAHLHFHSVLDEISQVEPEKECRYHRKHGEQEIRNRRDEIAVQFLSPHDPGISHYCDSFRETLPGHPLALR